MATQAADVRNSRVVILVSESEKRRIATNARDADMSVSDFMRTAAERYAEPADAPTDTEAALIGDLLRQLEAANAATEASLVKLAATAAHADAFDEPAYRRTVRAELEARSDVDWDRVAAYLGLGQA